MVNTKLIGNKIAEARKKLNLTQAQLAERLFITQQAVGKWERGESMPDITIFIQLAHIFGVNLDYFSESFQIVKNNPEPIDNQFYDKIIPKPKEQISWDLSKMNLLNCDFSGIANLKEKFSSSNISNSKFLNSELSGLLLKNNNVENCDFSKSKLNSSYIQKTNINKNVFIGSSIKETEFLECSINSCDFENVDFTKAIFSKTSFNNCNLSHANFTQTSIKFGSVEKSIISNAVLNQTSFSEIYFVDIVFDKKIENCCFENCKFTRVSFQNVTFINTFFKNNRKLKQVKFVNCKVDKITYSFLKNNFANLKGIELVSN